jgi:hypothetical protein
MSLDPSRREFMAAVGAVAIGAVSPARAAAGNDYRTAGELMKVLADRQVSSRDLVDAAIARIEAIDPKINAVVVRDFDRAREAAAAARPAISLLQDAMPRPGLPLVHFNDDRCGSAAELRSVILKARRLADDHAERERAAVAAKASLLAQIEKRRGAPAMQLIGKASDEPFAPERFAA